MGWSWDEFEDTPKWVVDVLIEQVQADEAKRESDRQADEAKRKHRGGRR